MLDETKTGPLESRGLDPEAAERLGARFNSGKFEFDYRDPMTGEPLFRKYKTLDKQYAIQPKGAKLVLWGLDRVPLFESRPAEALIITEGEEDRLAFAQVLGDEAFVVSVPNGVAGKRTEEAVLVKDDHRFGYLWTDDFKLHPKLEQFDRIILATDDDEMGRLLRDELAMRIGEARCWFAVYPKGCKDGNQALLEYGDKAIEQIYRRIKPMRPGHLVSIEDIPNTGRSIPYSTGMGFLDKNVMVIRPELMVITGMPGSGKGQFTRALAGHLALAHGWRTAFLAPEDPPHRLRRDFRRFAARGNRHPDAAQQGANRQFVRDHFMISTPPEDEPITMDMVIAEMETAALHHGCQVFVLDPWNEVSYDPLSGESETKNVERLLVLLKQKARRLNLLLVIVAHPRKPSAAGEEPNLYSISGSSNWFNKADHGIILVRLEGTNTTKIVIGKAKDHETMGKPGKVYAEFVQGDADFIEARRPEPTQRARPQEGQRAQKAEPRVPDGNMESVDGGIAEEMG